MPHFHISPSRNRESILAHGLRVWNGPSPFLWLLDDEGVARALASRPWGGQGDNDVWLVDAGGIALEPDPHPGGGDPPFRGHSFISRVPLPRERVALA